MIFLSGCFGQQYHGRLISSQDIMVLLGKRVGRVGSDRIWGQSEFDPTCIV